MTRTSHHFACHSDSSQVDQNAATRVEAPAGGPNATKIMIVGDSITHGHEGDWTWRYRIWEWLRSEEVDVKFVGPWKGTIQLDLPEPPRPPPLQSETPPSHPRPTNGGYALGSSPDFMHNHSHLAQWGWQAMQAKEVIQEHVAKYRPDFLWLELGFNDMGWFASGPDGTLDSVKTLVDRARAAKPDIRFVIANVPMRSLIPGREDLAINTKIYNSLLETAVPHWCTPGSRIELVRMCENYSYDEGTYDGLHPNALGEYQIAQAFSTTLVHGFGLGSNGLNIPATIPDRPTTTPSGVRAEASSFGITVSWEPVYGAFGYEVQARSVGVVEWNFNPVSTNRFDTIWCRDGDQWEYQVRTHGGDTVKSPWSDVVKATAHPRTAPGPKNIVTKTIKGGFVISWDPPDGDYVIDRYGVITHDADLPGAFPSTVGVRDTQVVFDNLPQGHRFNVAVETWTNAGGGIPSPGPQGIVG